jgi:hypothetical protein
MRTLYFMHKISNIFAEISGEPAKMALPVAKITLTVGDEAKGWP